MRVAWTCPVRGVEARGQQTFPLRIPSFRSSLYISFVRPFLEYAAPVWDPHHSTLIDKIEKVQRFALRMASKQWNSDYATLLAWSGLPTLQSRRRVLSLCFFAQSIHGVRCSLNPSFPSVEINGLTSEEF